MTLLDRSREHDLLSRLEGLELNKSNKEDQCETLQGFPWDNFSCSLDAILLVNMCIAEALGEEGYIGLGNFESDVLKQVSKDTLALMKTPWRDRNIHSMRQLRDTIRNCLLSKLAVEIGEGCCLEQSDKHIISSWLVGFPISMEIACAHCQSLENIERPRTTRGLSFCVRQNSLSGLSSLQDILTFLVPLPLYRTLTIRWRRDMGRPHQR